MCQTNTHNIEGVNSFKYCGTFVQFIGELATFCFSSVFWILLDLSSCVCVVDCWCDQIRNLLYPAFCDIVMRKFYKYHDFIMWFSISSQSTYGICCSYCFLVFFLLSITHFGNVFVHFLCRQIVKAISKQILDSMHFQFDLIMLTYQLWQCCHLKGLLVHKLWCFKL